MVAATNRKTLVRLPAIDALRGWAIFAVIVLHVATYVRPPEMLEPLARQGIRGVQLFFIVSALTLYMSMAHRSRDSGEIRDYFIRRFFRIAPSYYCAMWLWLALNGLEPNANAPGGITWATVLVTGLFGNVWQPDTMNAIIPGAWSIAVEMNFYVLLPIIATVVRDLRSAIVVGGAISLFGIAFGIAGYYSVPYIFGPISDDERSLAQSMFADFGVPISLPAFMAGIIIYFVQHSVVISRRRARILLAGSLLAFVAIAYTKLPLRNVWMVVPLGAFTIAMLQAESRPFVNKMTQYMGQRSYSAFFVNAIVLHFFAPHDLQRLGFFAALAVTMAATFLISEITYRLIEQPSQDAGRKIIAWFHQSHWPVGDPRQPAAAAGEKVAP